jgi:hypothetical protein
VDGAYEDQQQQEQWGIWKEEDVGAQQERQLLALIAARKEIFQGLLERDRPS